MPIEGYTINCFLLLKFETYMNHKPELIEEANEYIFELFKEKLSHKYVYHNYQHTLETVDVCIKLASEFEINEEAKEILLLAAWFHDSGYIYSYKGHEEKSAVIAKEFLEQKNYPQSKLEQVINCILSTTRERGTTNLIEDILCDADIASVGDKNFFAKAELLRTEWENFGIASCNDKKWAQTQMDFLSSVTFHTAQAQKLFGEQLALNLQEQRAELKKLQKKENKKNKDINKNKAQPKRGIETMFRSIYHSHIHLSSIADNKANMMIHINTIIISIMLTVVGAKFSFLGTSFKENQRFIFPVISLLLTGLASIIFAILSAKPKVTEKISSIDEIKRKNVSVLFFGNYSNLTIQEFESQMKDLMKSQELLYGNMIRDLYYLGKVLTQKYKLLRYSYLAFMLGLIITVFLVILIIVHLKEEQIKGQLQ
jgi:predicted metal-dependent HD superfamily phosphohydrolase